MMISRTLLFVLSLALSLLAAPISDPNVSLHLWSRARTFLMTCQAVDVGRWSVPTLQHKTDLKAAIKPNADTQDDAITPLHSQNIQGQREAPGTVSGDKERRDARRFDGGRGSQG